MRILNASLSSLSERDEEWDDTELVRDWVIDLLCLINRRVAVWTGLQNLDVLEERLRYVLTQESEHGQDFPLRTVFALMCHHMANAYKALLRLLEDVDCWAPVDHCASRPVGSLDDLVSWAREDFDWFPHDA